MRINREILAMFVLALVLWASGAASTPAPLPTPNVDADKLPAGNVCPQIPNGSYESVRLMDSVGTIVLDEVRVTLASEWKVQKVGAAIVEDGGHNALLTLHNGEVAPAGARLHLLCRGQGFEPPAKTQP